MTNSEEIFIEKMVKIKKNLVDKLFPDFGTGVVMAIDSKAARELPDHFRDQLRDVFKIHFDYKKPKGLNIRYFAFLGLELEDVKDMYSRFIDSYRQATSREKQKTQVFYYELLN